MPPEDVQNPPTAEQSAAVVQWLSDRIKEGEAARMAQRDRVSFRRRSREEYVHTIYDLLGVHFDATDPGGFSEDPAWHGFERLGSVLSLSASHVEKYFDAAEAVLSEAYPDQPVEPLNLLKPAVPPNTVQGPYLSRRAPRLKVYHTKLDRVLFEQDVVAPEDQPNLPGGG